jgi:hypothetical protein
MLNIQKSYVIDENQQPIAVQITLAEFERIEKILELLNVNKLAEDVKEPDTLLKEIEDEPYDWLPGELGSGKPVKYIEGVGLVIIDQ